MPQLIVRQIEDKVIRKLKARAGLHGVSTEQEHRQILRDVLLDSTSTRLSFKDYLRSLPKDASAAAFERARGSGRKISL